MKIECIRTHHLRDQLTAPFGFARQIAALREVLPETMLMADSNHAFDLPEAICIGHVLDEHDYYLAVPAVGGSWIAPRQLIQQEDGSAIASNAAESRRIIEDVRKGDIA